MSPVAARVGYATSSRALQMCGLLFGVDIAEWIRAHRRRTGLTQRQLAPFVRVDANTISRWEKRQNKPGVDQLRLLCIAFQASADEALGLTQQS